MTKEQIEQISDSCGVNAAPGEGGFITDTSGEVKQSMADEVMESLLDDDNPCVGCDTDCDAWTMRYCCCRCQSLGYDDCDDCDPWDI